MRSPRTVGSEATMKLKLHYAAALVLVGWILMIPPSFTAGLSIALQPPLMLRRWWKKR
jgi:hypothetical protein